MSTKTAPTERRQRRATTAKNRLREVREALHLTQEHLAAFLGVSQAAISNEERLGDTLGTHSYYRLADLFDVDPRELEGYKPSADLVQRVISNWSADKENSLKNLPAT